MNMKNKRYTTQFFSLPSKWLDNLSPGSNCRTHRTVGICGSHGSLPHSQPPRVHWVWHLWYGIFPLTSLD